MPPQAIPARPLLCGGLTFVQNLSGCLETHVVPKLLKGYTLHPGPICANLKKTNQKEAPL